VAAPVSPALPAATKAAPFVNSLGMKFVPVPGTPVLFCIWETRVRDYAEFAKANSPNDTWQKKMLHDIPISREPNDPVVAVNVEDSRAFCQWLTTKESAAGMLPRGAHYRLPTDLEWSAAVGLGEEEG